MNFRQTLIITFLFFLSLFCSSARASGVLDGSTFFTVSANSEMETLKVSSRSGALGVELYLPREAIENGGIFSPKAVQRMGDLDKITFPMVHFRVYGHTDEGDVYSWPLPPEAKMSVVFSNLKWADDHQQLTGRLEFKLEALSSPPYTPERLEIELKKTQVVLLTALAPSAGAIAIFNPTPAPVVTPAPMGPSDSGAAASPAPSSGEAPSTVEVPNAPTALSSNTNFPVNSGNPSPEASAAASGCSISSNSFANSSNPGALLPLMLLFVPFFLKVWARKS